MGTPLYVTCQAASAFSLNLFSGHVIFFTIFKMFTTTNKVYISDLR